jgi:hypothetical protein
VIVLVGVLVGVLVIVLVGVFVGVLVGVFVGVAVAPGFVLVGVLVTVFVGLLVGVLVMVEVFVLVGVSVGVLVGPVGVLVGVLVVVFVMTGVGVINSRGETGLCPQAVTSTRAVVSKKLIKKIIFFKKISKSHHFQNEDSLANPKLATGKHFSNFTLHLKGLIRSASGH